MICPFTDADLIMLLEWNINVFENFMKINIYIIVNRTRAFEKLV